MKRIAPLVTAIVTVLGVLAIQPAPAPAQTASPITFGPETFDSDAATPINYRPPGWDVSVVAHSDESIDGMMAEHSAECGPPDEAWVRGTAPRPESHHFINRVDQTVFNCKDHLMTATSAGYSAIYITPPALLDFRNGPATVKWSMSTQRTASRDWVDFVLMPFSPEREDLPPPMALNFDDAHVPEAALWIELQGSNVLMGRVLNRMPASQCGHGSYVRQPSGMTDCRMSFDGYHTWDMVLQTYGLAASAVRRDEFIMEVSQTHLKVGFRPAKTTGPYFYWVNADIPGGLTFDEALIQFNQRAYNPLKPCADGLGTNAHAGEPGAQDGWEGNCRANTWHWDDVSISPATPFTIYAGPRKVGRTSTVVFPAAAPPTSFIKAAGDWGAEYSVDGGRTYQRLPEVGDRLGPENGISYWGAVPEGVDTVQFRMPGANDSLQDIYLYSRTPRDVIPQPTPGPTVEPTDTPTPTTTPTRAPTRTPTPTPIPNATATPTAVPTATSTATPPPTPTATPTSTPVVPPTTTPIPTSTAVPSDALPCVITIGDATYEGECVRVP